MKRLLLGGLVAFLTASTASAQGPLAGKFEMGVSGGANLPIGQLKDSFDPGYVFGTTLGYRMTPRFILGSEVALHGQDGSWSAENGNLDVTNAIVQYAAMAKLYVTEGMKNVYLKAVTGNYAGNVTATRRSTKIYGRDSEFGAGLGVGFQLNGPNIGSLFVEASLHRLFDNEDPAAHFFTISSGVVFQLGL